MFLVSVVFSILASAAAPDGFSIAKEPDHVDVIYNGRVWLRTMTIPYDAQRAEETYKVYTHVFDFAGIEPITKGPGGKYSHHRGLFIGWKRVIVEDKAYNFWEMDKTYQKHVAWLALEESQEKARHTQQIIWSTIDGQDIIEEIRTIETKPLPDGLRSVDFVSSLKSLVGDLALKGDSHHAGMQIRLADEVSQHEQTTQYILPDGAQEKENDEVVGAWWVCCSAEIRGKRYWIMHMTPRDHPTGQPVYSIRRYARFGAFFETELKTSEPLHVRFRLIFSDRELTAETCAALYDAYVGEAR